MADNFHLTAGRPGEHAAKEEHLTFKKVKKQELTFIQSFEMNMLVYLRLNISSLKEFTKELVTEL